MTLKKGTGSRIFGLPEISASLSYRETFFSVAAADAAAILTPSIAFAPRFDLFFVPSKSIMNLSSRDWSKNVIPFSMTAGAILLLTFATAFRTDFP